MIQKCVSHSILSSNCSSERSEKPDDIAGNVAAEYYQNQQGKNLKMAFESDHLGIFKAEALLEGSCCVLLTMNPIAIQAETVYLSWRNTQAVYQLGHLSETTGP